MPHRYFIFVLLELLCCFYIVALYFFLLVNQRGLTAQKLPYTFLYLCFWSNFQIWSIVFSTFWFHDILYGLIKNKNFIKVFCKLFPYQHDGLSFYLFTYYFYIIIWVLINIFYIILIIIFIQYHLSHTVDCNDLSNPIMEIRGEQNWFHSILTDPNHFKLKKTD